MWCVFFVYIAYGSQRQIFSLFKLKILLLLVTWIQYSIVQFRGKLTVCLQTETQDCLQRNGLPGVSLVTGLPTEPQPKTARDVQERLRVKCWTVLTGPPSLKESQTSTEGTFQTRNSKSFLLGSVYFSDLCGSLTEGNQSQNKEHFLEKNQGHCKYRKSIWLWKLLFYFSLLKEMWVKTVNTADFMFPKCKSNVFM